MTTKGQSLVEFLILFPVILGFWAAMVWFARVIVIKIEVMHAARHGVFFLASNHDMGITSQQEKGMTLSECQDFLVHEDPSVDLSRVAITVEPGDRWSYSSQWKQLFDLPFLLGLSFAPGQLQSQLSKWIGLKKHYKSAAVTVEYDLPAPPLLRVIRGFPVSFHLRGYCECYR